MTILMLLSSLLSRGQTNPYPTNARTVHLPNLFSSDAIVFNDFYDPGIKITDIQGRFTPTISEIELSEDILKEKYNDLRKSDINFKRHFCQYIRQYIGIIDHSGNKNIILQLINGKNKRKLRKSIGNSYKNHFVVQFDDERVQNEVFKINLKNRTLTTQL